MPPRRKPAAASIDPTPKRRPAAAETQIPKRRRRSKAASGASTEDVVQEWSYDRLWDDVEAENWHGRNLRFWRAQGTDLRGMTGGGVSDRDLAFSRRAVEDLAAALGKPGKLFGRSLDCGAGIGRVSRVVLRHCCTHIDLVEFVKKHLLKAEASLPRSSKNSCSFAFHNSSMQQFDIKAGTYDLIWCQWLLMYVTDADARELLKKAGAGLADGGMLVVKENISTHDKATYFDDGEGELWEPGDSGVPVSCVRTSLHYEDIFERAGLQIRGERTQTDLGPGCMEIRLWLLEPAGRGGDALALPLLS